MSKIKKTFLSFVFHAYQPPIQEKDVLIRINNECYRPVLELFDRLVHVKISLNINSILIDLLLDFGLEDTIELIKKLYAEDKIEILGTAKYHPILSLIPKKEVIRQIEMDKVTKQRYINNKWIGKTFFPPELAINTSLLKTVKNLGYKSIILSGIACPANWPYDRIYTTPNGLQLFFRDDFLSNKIAFNNISASEFIDQIKRFRESDSYIVICLDIETFGHHIRGYEKTFIKKTFDLIEENNNQHDKNRRDRIEIEFISNLDHYFPIAEEKLIPRPSSWSTTYHDLIDKIPYPLWKHPDNDIHKYYWKIVKSLNKLMDLADNLDLTESWNVENYYNTARYFYDRGLHSCPMWWANAIRDIWSPNLIYKGIELLLRAALNAQLALVNAGVSNGDGYFDSISYYHGLLLMELYSISKKNLRKTKIN